MTNRTIQTYNRIAQSYRLANENRHAIQPQIEQFTRHLPRNSTVLDVGCGPALDTPLLQQAGST